VPYPNEHSCRLRDPGDFQANSFRRMSMTQKSTGKRISVIIGRLKGASKTTTQALRYPVGSWSEPEARADCKKNGGTFHPAG